MMSRKVDASICASVGLPFFNGAATMMSRKARVDVVPISTCLPLQWSRDDDVAESGRKKAIDFPSPYL